MGNPGLFVYILQSDKMRAVEYRVEMGGALRSSPSSTKGGGNVSENRARCRMPILVHFEGALLLLLLLSCTAGKEGHMSPVRTLISHLGWAHCLTLSLAAPLLRRAGRSVDVQQVRALPCHHPSQPYCVGRNLSQPFTSSLLAPSFVRLFGHSLSFHTILFRVPRKLSRSTWSETCNNGRLNCAV